MKPLPSISQAQIKYFQRLTQKKYRSAEHKFLIEGTHLVEEAISSDWTVETLLMSGAFQKRRECANLIRHAKRKSVSMVEVGEREIEKLSDTVTAQGIIGVVSMKEYPPLESWKSSAQRSLIVALDDVADPGNVGTILRTCDWFGVDAVLLNNNTVEIFNPKVLRASMGAIFHVPILSDLDLLVVLEEAKKNGFRIISTAVEGGRPFPMKSYPQKCIIVLGNEGRGVSKDVVSVTDDVITIPKYGRAESLNVAITCGIALATIRLVG